jgi:hypothetical protein
MIEFEKFQDCFDEYLREFVSAEKEYKASRANLVRACEGIICHPNTTADQKAEIQAFRQELLTGEGS